MAEKIDTRFLNDLAPSLGVMLRTRVQASPDDEAYRFLRGTDWVSVTWADAAVDVDEVAAGLLALGLAREDRVAIIANTRYEWILADLGVMCAGGATTTVYPTSSPEDAAYILADAQCRFAIVESDAQREALEARREALPHLETIVVMDAESTDALSLDEVRRRGRAHLEAHPDTVTVATDAIGPEDLATLIYTSGTTGRPKGVRLTQRCWVYEGEALKALGFLRADDLNFLWLPMSHSFGKMILSAQLAVGFATAIDGRVDKIIDNLAVIRPTFMGAAPRIFEKAYGKIVSMQAAEGGLKETTAGAFCGRPVDNRFDTVGRALPGSEVRIAEDGEIHLRGPHIMSGYNNLPAETESAFTADGWLRTGDQDSLDADGFLTITGRLKDQIKTSGGKIVIPGAVEAAFKALCPYVSQFLVFGDGHPYCVALLTLDPDAIAAWCADNGVTASDYQGQVSSPEVHALVAGYIEQLNARLNKWETVKRWTILDADLSIEGGELTPSMKVKRGLVETAQRERIEAMYAG